MLKPSVSLNFRKKKARRVALWSHNIALFVRKLRKAVPTYCTNSLSIRVAQNNIFGTFSRLPDWHTMRAISAGIYNIKVSRRQLKTALNAFVDTFLKKLRVFFRKTYIRLAILLEVPRFLRKGILLKTQKYLFKLARFILIQPRKCFNGCRVKKMRRKKFKKYRVLK